MRCSLGEAEPVAQSGAARFDGIALSSRGRDALAAWSDSSGTFVRWLGQTKRPAARVAERCAGGVALGLAHDAAYVACLAAEGAYVLRLEGAGLRPGARIALAASAGRDAHGISLALQPAPAGARAEPALYVAWEDGVAGDPKVQLATINEPASPGAAARVRPLSRAHANGHEPQLLWHQAALWASWTESELTPGKTRHHVVLQRGGQPPARLAEVAGESPRPALGADAEGVVLAYRAARRVGLRGELWLGRVDPSGRKLRAPARAIGRANGSLGPSLSLCRTTRAVAVPIDHASELYVALHPLSAALTSSEENHQYYESGKELVTSVAACVGDHPLVLLAEQTDPARPAARLLSTAFRCASDGVPAARESLVSSRGGLPKDP